MNSPAPDQYTGLASPVHRLDARTKILGSLALILVCVSTPPQAWGAFAGYLALVGVILAASRVPAVYLLKRSLVVLPFVALVAVFIPFQKARVEGGGYDLGLAGLHVSRTGLLIFWNVLIKSWIGMLATLLLTTTTPFPQLLQGLEQLGAPKLLTMLVGFTYRYIFVLTEEALRMKRALEARGYRGTLIWHARTIGQMIGTLFLRSYERGERVYQAMIARGFEGRAVGLGSTRLCTRDYLGGLAILAALILLRVACA